MIQRRGGASTVQEERVIQDRVLQEEGVIQRVNSNDSKEQADRLPLIWRRAEAKCTLLTKATN